MRHRNTWDSPATNANRQAQAVLERTGCGLKKEAGRYSVRSPRPVSCLARGCVVVACHVEEPPLVDAGTAQIRDGLEAEGAVRPLLWRAHDAEQPAVVRAR